MTEGSNLCTDCGICCDGTLFNSVSLDAPGLVTARAHHLPVLETATECKLELPCPAMRGVLCEIYESRPEQCGDYACELRLRVDEDQLSAGDARKIIEETRTIHAEVKSVIGATPWWTARRAALEAARNKPSSKMENGELLTALNRLEELVRLHFWG